LPCIISVVFDSSSSGDDVDPWVPHRRIRLPGGVGTCRMDRVAPRPYLPSINGRLTTRRHLGIDGEWSLVYFNPQAPPRLGDRAWEDFRDKFRLPLPMLNWVKDGRYITL
jgi:hypothetical protein